LRWSYLPAILFGTIYIFLLVFIRILDPYPVRAVREIAFDQFQRMSPRPYQDLPVRIVDIDEVSLQAYGQWPWPRTLLADLVERLKKLGAAAIVFDVLFVEEDRLSPSRIFSNVQNTGLITGDQLRSLKQTFIDHDQIFSKSLAGANTVLGYSVISGKTAVTPPVKAGIVVVGTDPSPAVPHLAGATAVLPILLDSAAGLGNISLSPTDTVSVVRKVPLIWSDNLQFYPSLAIESLRVAQGVSTIVVHSTSKYGTAVESIRVGEFQVPTTADGSIWVYYNHDRPDRYVSAAQILRGTYDAEIEAKIAGNIVLIGTSASGLFDIRATALGENVPGVSVQAQVLEQIIGGSFLHRADWFKGLEIIILVLVATYVVLMSFLAGPLVSFIGGGIIAFGVAIATWLAFARNGLLIDPTFPIAGGMTSYLIMTSFNYLTADREKRQIRNAFSQFVAPTVLERIERKPDALKLGGEIRNVTVLFVDVRDFTPLSEKLSPVALVDFLNSLFDLLSDDVIARQGTIDKYIGDSLMAFWNAPVDIPDHRLEASRAALQMRRSLKLFNQRRFDDSLSNREVVSPISIGVGLSSGEACVGNMGSRRRFNYSVVGDTVNVASRVESSCRRLAFDILLSASTAAGVAGMATLWAGAVTMKGKSRPVSVHILVGDEEVTESREFTELVAAHHELLQILGGGSGNFATELMRARSAGDVVLSELAKFYDAIPSRQADFATFRDYATMRDVR